MTDAVAETFAAQPLDIRLRVVAGDPAQVDTIKAMAKDALDEIERLRAVADISTDLVALWKNQRIQGLSRAERNAAIEDTRNRLIEAVDQMSDLDTKGKTDAKD